MELLLVLCLELPLAQLLLQAELLVKGPLG
jgi:hypothetical protein